MTAPVRNARQVMDGRALLRSIRSGSAALAFLDPQYRSVLDRQKYGNEGKRQIERAKLPQMSDAVIRSFVAELERALKPSGHLVLWTDKFLIGEGAWRRWLPSAWTTLALVDVIAWNKGRPGMGRRARCRTEYAVVLQKAPLRAKGVWTDHRLDDCWTEDADRGRHPHAKPLQLTQRIIAAVTKRGDLVLDPAAGGYAVLDACVATRREFLGCDLIGGGE